MYSNDRYVLVQSLLREEMATVMKRAGFAVLPDTGLADTAVSADEITGTLSRCNCSVHILSNEYKPILIADTNTSLSKFQFYEARKRSEANPNFKMFIWLPPSTNNPEPLQQEYINEVRNNISKNMVFSNAASSLQLVDDIRSIMETKTVEDYNLNSTDIFLISNQLDDTDATEIIDMLSDIIPVEKLNIIQDSDTDYSELCKQQIPKSKLAVIYFKQSAEWAIPFAQQVWKKVGGATSHTPILLIGDENPDTNMGKKFNAPKVISLIIAGELIPLEIKVQFDKATGAA
jgi:hypothetical protein